MNSAEMRGRLEQCAERASCRGCEYADSCSKNTMLVSVVAALEEMEAKHWNECWQIAQYDDELRREKGAGMSKDSVNHPEHYTTGGIECISAIQASLSPAGFKAYCKGNCLKYLWRYEHKNGVEDLEKARVYLNWLIDAANDEIETVDDKIETEDEEDA